MRHARPAMAAAIAAAVIAASPIAGSALAQPAVPQQIAPQAAQAETVTDQVKSVLSQYGSFVQHPKYGEVWVPTVTPQGWHPYPACQWVKSAQYGWYFDDRTPWGQIVHHYGRWAHDDQMGWIWIPGSEFSPGWVVWRTSPQWIGWAPMAPDQDLKTVSVDQFNNSDEWTFISVGKFSTGCDRGDALAAQQIPLVLKQTKYVTQLAYVGGIAVFVLPPYIVGPIVDINVTFNPWPPWFFGKLVMNWNWLWQNTLIWNVNVVCAP
jgi:Family of unknown function (DUF6600)